MKKNSPVDMDGLKSLPSAPEVEDAVIGSFLVDPGVRESVIDKLEAEDFTNPQMKSVFLAIKNLDDEGVAIDLASVANRLREMGYPNAVGGIAGLSTMAAQMGACSNIEYSVQILRQKSLLRRVMLASLETIKDAGAPSVNADSLVAEALERLEKACGIITESAEVPMAEMHDFSVFLRQSTQGRGTYTFEFVRYEDAPANIAQKVIEQRKAEASE